MNVLGHRSDARLILASPPVSEDDDA